MIATRTKGLVPSAASYRDELVIGEQDHVRNVLAAAVRRGDLVGTARPVLLADGRVRVACRFREPVATVTPPPKPRSGRRYAIAGGLAAVLAALATLVWLVLSAVAWVFAHLAAIASTIVGLVGTVLLIGLVLILLGQAGMCPGIHCPGCKCGGSR